MEVLLGQFKKSLTASGLMTAEEVEAFSDSLPSDNKPKDGAELAKALVRHKQLTKFQTQAIFQGKTKGLIMGDYIILDRIGEGDMGRSTRLGTRLSLPMDRFWPRAASRETGTARSISGIWEIEMGQE